MSVQLSYSIVIIIKRVEDIDLAVESYFLFRMMSTTLFAVFLRQKFTHLPIEFTMFFIVLLQRLVVKNEKEMIF